MTNVTLYIAASLDGFMCKLRDEEYRGEGADLRSLCLPDTLRPSVEGLRVTKNKLLLIQTIGNTRKEIDLDLVKSFSFQRIVQVHYTVRH